jgi:HK97 family phage major capsid protein
MPLDLAPELKAMQEHVSSALNELKGAVDSKNVDTIKSVEAFLLKYDTAAQAHHNKLIASQKAADDRVADLEAAFATKNASGAGDDRNSVEYKSFFEYAKAGPTGMDTKTLRSDAQVSGGYLIPKIMDNQIIKDITELSPVRRFAKIRRANVKTIEMPRRLSNIVAEREGEGEEAQKSTQGYGTETITMHRLSVTVPATRDMLMNSAFDMETEITGDVSEAMGKREGFDFVRGSGNKEPKGFMNDARVEVLDSADVGKVDFNDIAELIGRLKNGQKPDIFFNRRTLTKLWQIRTTTGEPIWTPVGASGQPAAIWGFNYCSEFIDMDDLQSGSGAKPIAFGDMKRAYTIYDRTGTAMIFNPFSKAGQNIVEWTFHRYNDGAIVQPEAMKILRVK